MIARTLQREWVAKSENEYVPIGVGFGSLSRRHELRKKLCLATTAGRWSRSFTRRGLPEGANRPEAGACCAPIRSRFSVVLAFAAPSTPSTLITA